MFSRFLPSDIPSLFTPELVRYIVSSSWIGIGSSDDGNATKAFRSPLSGIIAGLPGVVQTTQAALALTMCARWGSKLAPIDKPLFSSLRQLVGPIISWWYEFVGTAVRLLAIVSPAANGEFLFKILLYVLVNLLALLD